ncbi:DUF2163 domain-containing protein [Pseudorhodobacter sp.]|uniref:DUF2163 domain-containing protein n=1 Tax=Pseudorhodobacter sp. TaxID=1934400 RepID=UPI002648487E|nr:DUF2163 domain-containing protein [Pseudorhodobacter sp.]MDN5786015.1 DUF2163 domain-containing protein [Pseudorhodobacter sp.]
MSSADAFYSHLESGTTTTCHAWEISRSDGVWFGFTDHDCNLDFGGKLYLANSGLTAKALQQTTGLSVDNTEAMGALSALSVTEDDILAGRFDGAELVSWQVNWANPQERALAFRGTIGEIARSGGAFQAELRGLTESINQPQGRAFQRSCPAILGDGKCGFDLSQPGYSIEIPVEEVTDRRVFTFSDLTGFEDRWFERGRLVVVSGTAKAVVGIIKNDRLQTNLRRVELWQGLGPEIVAGDMIRLEAGCDKAAGTCRLKFDNFTNFRGFPDIPGEGWLTSYPVSSQANSGGSLVR